MKPISHKLPCSPTSSNCVSWEGPDLPCISLCRGDSVTEVVYQSAVVLCQVKDELNLSALDLKNLFSVCAACPQPAKTLKNILELLINKVKSLEELIGDLDGGNSSEEVLIRIASCFRNQDSSGDMVTELKHSDYTRAIGLQVCTVLTELAGINTRLNGLENDMDEVKDRLNVLETGDNSLDQLQDELEALQSSFNGLRTVMGTNAQLAAISAEECPTSGPGNSVPSLAAGDGSALWTGSSSNAAESLKRMWTAICDVRAAVRIIQLNCCSINCDDIVIDFDIRLNADRTQATLFFAFKSHIPIGFSDVNALGNKLTVTDDNGASAQFFIKLSDEAQNPDGLIIDLGNTALDTTSPYYFSMDAAMKSENLTCVKCITKSVNYVAPGCDYCEITATGVGGDLTGSIIVLYQD